MRTLTLVECHDLARSIDADLTELDRLASGSRVGTLEYRLSVSAHLVDLLDYRAGAMVRSGPTPVYRWCSNCGMRVVPCSGPHLCPECFVL